MINFTISEMLATSYPINNMPTNKKVYDNLLKLIVEVLQPIRNKIGKPMIITSGYRSDALNTKVGGSKTSQHLTGEACDFVINGMKVEDIVAIVRKMDIPYGQLIEEHKGSTSWVHISIKSAKHNKEVLRYLNGKYSII